MLTELQIAYYAGFFDGEGHATIRRQNNYSGNKRVWWNLWVAVSNVRIEPLTTLHQEFGGSLLALKNWKTHRPLIRWSCASNQAAHFMRTVQPYCILKSEIIIICLEFQDHVRTHGMPGGRKHADGHTGHAHDTWTFREQLYLKVKQLNQRGVHNEPSS